MTGRSARCQLMMRCHHRWSRRHQPHHVVVKPAAVAKTSAAAPVDVRRYCRPRRPPAANVRGCMRLDLVRSILLRPRTARLFSVLRPSASTRTSRRRCRRRRSSADLATCVARRRTVMGMVTSPPGCRRCRQSSSILTILITRRNMAKETRNLLRTIAAEECRHTGGSVDILVHEEGVFLPHHPTAIVTGIERAAGKTKHCWLKAERKQPEEVRMKAERELKKLQQLESNYKEIIHIGRNRRRPQTAHTVPFVYPSLCFPSHPSYPPPSPLLSSLLPIPPLSSSPLPPSPFLSPSRPARPFFIPASPFYPVPPSAPLRSRPLKFS